MHDLESRLRAYGAVLEEAAEDAERVRDDDIPVLRLQADRRRPRRRLLPAAALLLVALGTAAVLAATMSGSDDRSPAGVGDRPGSDPGVIDDDPRAGDTAVAVPDVVGLPATEAREALRSAGFAVEEADVADPSASQGLVVGQHPVPGSNAEPGSTVTIEVPTPGGEGRDPTSYLTPLEGYTIEDVETGELAASLDHGVPYVDLLRRLVLDDDGFQLASITVVTLQPGTDGAERYLDHVFGDAPREPVEAGAELVRIPTRTHDALVWIGPDAVITFERGQDVSDQWLRELALAALR